MFVFWDLEWNDIIKGGGFAYYEFSGTYTLRPNDHVEIWFHLQICARGKLGIFYDIPSIGSVDVISEAILKIHS